MPGGNLFALFILWVSFEGQLNAASGYTEGWFLVVYLPFEGRLATQSFIANDITVQLMDADLNLRERPDKDRLLHSRLHNRNLLSLTQKREAEATGLHFPHVRDPTLIVN